MICTEIFLEIFLLSHDLHTIKYKDYKNMICCVSKRYVYLHNLQPNKVEDISVMGKFQRIF